MWEAITAAIVSIIVSTGVTLWLRTREQPQPDWIFARLTMSVGRLGSARLSQVMHERPPDFMVTATNAGDGTAYKVGVEGVEADARLFIMDDDDVRGFRVPANIALVRPGEEVGILIWFHPIHQNDKVGFRLVWLASPVRRMKTERREVLLSDPEPQPRRVPLFKQWALRLQSFAASVTRKLTPRQDRV